MTSETVENLVAARVLLAARQAQGRQGYILTLRADCFEVRSWPLYR